MEESRIKGITVIYVIRITVLIRNLTVIYVIRFNVLIIYKLHERVYDIEVEYIIYLSCVILQLST